MPGSSPIDSSPTRARRCRTGGGRRRPHLGELHEPLRLHLGVRAGVEQHGGRSPGTGMGVAIAGRLTPFMRPIRSSADAIVAPVLPAETIADARPSRTASAARTRVESFFVRTPRPASSSIR